MSYSDYIASQQLAHQLAAALKRAEAAEVYAKSLNDIIDTRERDLRAQAVDIECALQLIKRLERQVLDYQAELEKQEVECVVTTSFTGIKEDYTISKILPVGTELFTRPAPAADLAEIVPEDLNGKSLSYIADKFQVSISEAQFILVGFNACRTTILRKIEEEK